jgi:hypothetical protein
VVVKRADGADRDRLRLEGERLARASHPGVVQVLRSGRVGDGWELRTAHAGRPLSSLDGPEVREVASLVASAATTLADLHQLGLIHGRIDGSHVLVGEQGRAVLCGFGDGHGGARPEADVAALGTLLERLLGAGDDDLEPIPVHRWRRPRTWSGWERRALLLLADQATAEPATRRPTARRLAAAIAEAVPELGPPDPAERRDAKGADVDPVASLRAGVLVDARERRRTPAGGVLAAALVAVVLVAAGLRDGPRRSEEAGAPTSRASEPPPTAATVEGSVLHAEGRRYRVGQAGDEVLVDDWDCDGTPTPALLRPSTGEVYLFPRWIEDATLTVEPIVTVPGAAALVSEPLGDGCADLVVRTRGGAVVPVIEAGP